MFNLQCFVQRAMFSLHYDCFLPAGASSNVYWDVRAPTSFEYKNDIFVFFFFLLLEGEFKKKNSLFKGWVGLSPVSFHFFLIVRFVWWNIFITWWLLWKWTSFKGDLRQNISVLKSSCIGHKNSLNRVGFQRCIKKNWQSWQI